MLSKCIHAWPLGVVLVLLLTAACTGGSPTLSETAKDQAVKEIMRYPEVLGAAVNQQGSRLTLAIVVPFGSAESVAKAAGDNFVRVVKSFGPETTPATEIGTGDFDYSVTVVYPDKTVIIRGAKVSTSPRVTWPRVIHPSNLPQVAVPPFPLSTLIPA